MVQQWAVDDANMSYALLQLQVAMQGIRVSIMKSDLMAQRLVLDKASAVKRAPPTCWLYE